MAGPADVGVREVRVQHPQLLELVRRRLVGEHDQEVDVAVHVRVGEGERALQVRTDEVAPRMARARSNNWASTEFRSANGMASTKVIGDLRNHVNDPYLRCVFTGAESGERMGCWRAAGMRVLAVRPGAARCGR